MACVKLSFSIKSLFAITAACAISLALLVVHSARRQRVIDRLDHEPLLSRFSMGMSVADDPSWLDKLLGRSGEVKWLWFEGSEDKGPKGS